MNMWPYTQKNAWLIEVAYFFTLKTSLTGELGGVLGLGSIFWINGKMYSIFITDQVFYLFSWIMGNYVFSRICIFKNFPNFTCLPTYYSLYSCLHIKITAISIVIFLFVFFPPLFFICFLLSFILLCNKGSSIYIIILFKNLYFIFVESHNWLFSLSLIFLCLLFHFFFG